MHIICAVWSGGGWEIFLWDGSESMVGFLKVLVYFVLWRVLRVASWSCDFFLDRSISGVLLVDNDWSWAMSWRVLKQWVVLIRTVLQLPCEILNLVISKERTLHGERSLRLPIYMRVAAGYFDVTFHISVAVIYKHSWIEANRPF